MPQPAGVRTFVSDVAEGFFEITHNGFALVGLARVFAVLALAARPDLRQTGEDQLMGWLQARKPAPEAIGMPLELDAIERATAANPQDLPKQQAAVAYWLSKKYRVAPEPLERAGGRGLSKSASATKLDPTLILADHGDRIGLQSLRPEPGGRPGPDAGHDRRPQREVRELRRQAGRLRPGDQHARGRQGAAGMHPARRLARGRAAGTTWAPPTWPTTAAMPTRCWPSTQRLQQVAAGRAPAHDAAGAAPQPGPAVAPPKRRARADADPQQVALLDS